MLRSASFVLAGVLAAAPAASLAQSSSAPSSASGSGTTLAPAGPAADAAAPSAALAAAEAAIAQSDWKTAETRLDTYLAAHPTDARALFDAGYVADAQNRPADAASLYRRAVAANPKSFEARISLGLLLAREQKFAEARPELAAATELDPGAAGPALKARAWRALARIDETANPAAASNDLLEALKLSPETPDDTLLAAELAEKTGQNDAAEEAYRRVLAKEPHATPASIGLARLLILRQQFADAETILRAALVSAPDDPTLNAQLALVLAAQNKAEALPLLEKLHAAHPADAAIARMLAQVMAEAGDYAASDQIDAKLLAASPDDPDLLVAHGQNLVRQARLAEAMKVFARVTQIDPANADGWSGLAFTASRTGQPDLALHALAMRSRYAQENASSLFLWAISYDALHQKQDAIAYYQRFLAAAQGKMPDQQWQARQRLQLLEREK